MRPWNLEVFVYTAAQNFAAVESLDAVTQSFKTFWLADPNKTDEPVPQWESRANQPGFVVFVG
ncbi:MAG TPA: hypothetical protein VNS62_07360 [Candidatus Udaeobacter sp.]|nr:hypothetical protein [Candidatus Udaeobacter sp.]